MASPAPKPSILISRLCRRRRSPALEAGPRWTSTRPTRRSGGRSCIARLQGRQGLVCLITDAIDAPAPGRLPGSQGGVQRGRRLQQHRRGGGDQARGGRHEYSRRPHRNHRGFRLDAAHGDGPAGGRGRPLRPRRASSRSGSSCCSWAATSTARPSASSASAASAAPWPGGRGLRHARPLPGCGRRRRRHRNGAPGHADRHRHAAPGIGLRHAAHAAPAGDPAPDQRAVAQDDEEDRLPGQRLARARRRRGRAGPGAQGGLDRRRGHRRLRRGARGSSGA